MVLLLKSLNNIGWGRKFRMFRFDPLGTLLMPLSRLKLELWMRRVRMKYNV